MSNRLDSKFNASLSIEELLTEQRPEFHQQNWLLPYLDVFVLIIMLIVTLLALSDFEAKNKDNPQSQQVDTKKAVVGKKDSSNKVAENKKRLTKIQLENPVLPAEAEDIKVIDSKEQTKVDLPQLSQQFDNNKPVLDKKDSLNITAENKINQTEIKQQLTSFETQENQIDKPELVAEIESIKPVELKPQTKAGLLPNNQVNEGILQKQLAKTVEELGLIDAVNMKVSLGYAQLEIQDKILFESSEANLLDAGEKLLKKLAPLLEESLALIYIEGHTDNRPIKTDKFPSNWELGAARATSVLHYLVTQRIDSSRLRAITYADTKPIADNLTAEGRERNRRVSITIKVSSNNDL